MGELIVYHREGYLKEGLVELCEVLKRKYGKLGSIVEIGSHAGESAEIFSEYFRNVVCVDPWDGGYLQTTYGKEMDPAEIERSFDERMRHVSNITKLKMASPGAAKLFPDLFFDGVYIDGLHDRDSVAADIEAWSPKVKSFISGHDWVDGAPDVIWTVVNALGMPDFLFRDYSWLKTLDLTKIEKLILSYA